MSCGVGHRHSSGLTLLWLWYRPAAVASIGPLDWGLPYAADVVLKRKINKWINKIIKIRLMIT